MAIGVRSRDECLRVLSGASLARLGCARENQPYVVPVCLAFHQPSSGDACLYGFTTPGQKLQWMRSNPLVCVEVDEVAAHDQWVSVIAFGRYEELPETTESAAARLRAPERPHLARESAVALSAEGRHRQYDDGCDDGQDRAWQVLKTHPEWWEPGCTAWAARAHRDPAEPYVPVYYKIHIGHVTGHEATRDARDATSSATTAPSVGRWDWLRKTLTRVFAGRPKGAGSAS
jgi:nitroimidazol reductase NimA-like FMN-containing flavoprotein (pyridoxamine 5'-phosphate oxidase superfamily)